MESVRHENAVPSARLNDMNSSITLDFKIRHFKIKCFPAAEQDRRPERDRGGNKHKTLENMLTEINDNTPIAMLTVGQLKEVLKGGIPTQVTVQEAPKKNLVFGYQGLAAALNVSIGWAGKLIRSGRIKDAVTQEGRTIIIDLDKALDLLKQKTGGRMR